MEIGVSGSVILICVLTTDEILRLSANLFLQARCDCLLC
jgi:hypothetical protein